MRRNQRGFLYLTSGANGSGKTLFTLKEVHDRALKESRPVCYNGRFDLNPDGPLSAWKKIDIKDWQAEPDGTIFFVDECHNDFPVRSAKDAAPEYVRMLAEHRKRGFDFYLITQHPQNIDVFVRRLIGSPGWHRHLKRTFGADLISQLEWAAVNPACERPGSGESGAVSMRAYPKEVYKWYHSAQLHTGKTRVPKMVWVMLACVVLIPALAYAAYSVLTKPAKLPAKLTQAAEAATASRASGSAMGHSVPSGSVSPADYMAARVPRIEGLAYTAPAYDGVTAPVTAPYPAACVSGFNRRLARLDCSCYSQQGTQLQVPAAVCQQIAEKGFFIDWQQAPGAAHSPPAPAPVSPAPTGATLTVTAASGDLVRPEPVNAASVADGAALGAMRSGQRRW